MVDPKIDLRDFLRTNLDETAISVTFAKADDIVIGNVDDGLGPYPQVAIPSRDSAIVAGGDTGVTAVDQTNDAPVQLTIQRVQVDCWGGPRTASIYSQENSDPDTVATELGEEVASTCRVGEGGAPTGYGWMMAEPPFEADDTERETTHHREIVIVRMGLDYGP